MTESTFSPEYARLCTVLTEGRQAAGLTQTALAEKLGRPQSYVSKYERAERRLDVIEMIQIARVLGLDPQDIVRQLMLPEEKQ